jgi:hypothetical protein
MTEYPNDSSGERQSPLAALALRVALDDRAVDTQACLADRERSSIEIDVPIPAKPGNLAAP